MSEPQSVSCGDVRTDSNIPGEFSSLDLRQSRERQHVCGLSLPRNFRFKTRISLLPVTRRLTAPFNPTTRRARSTKRSSMAPLSPAIRLFKVTNFLCSTSAAFLGGLCDKLVFYPTLNLSLRAKTNRRPIRHPPVWNLQVTPQFRFPPVTRQRPARFLFQKTWTFRCFVHRLPRLLLHF